MKLTCEQDIKGQTKGEQVIAPKWIIKYTMAERFCFSNEALGFDQTIYINKL